MDVVCSRRDALKAAELGAAALALPTFARAAPAPVPGRTRVARVAHLTDWHLQPERRADEGVARCLHAVQALKDPPSLILGGGDLVFDTYDAPFERSRALWDLLKGTLARECTLPLAHCLGNHDIFGWNKERSKTTGAEPQWGKNWAMEMLGLTRPYHALDLGPWRVLMLDSVQPFEGSGYFAKIDDDQFAWLKGELAAQPERPKLVVSHVPIIGVTMLGSDAKARAHTSPWWVMHSDALVLHELFAASNVRLCLSGHLHRRDRVERWGLSAASSAPPVTYLCDGAVCGSWWKGREDRCDEGFGVIDLFDDGSFEHRYETFGWNAQQ